jgi:hypothetical protein
MATQSHRSNGRKPQDGGTAEIQSQMTASVPKIIKEWNEGIDEIPQDEQREAARQLDRNPA